MRLSRTQRSAIVVLLLAFLGSSGTAADGSSLGTAQSGPTFMAGLDYATRTYVLDARCGLPGGAGSFNFMVMSGPAPLLVQIPFTFDGSGNATAAIPLGVLATGSDMAIAVQCIATGTDGILYDSPLWALTTRNYIVTDPNNPPCTSCPGTAGGWIDWLPWPGATGGPLYPHTTVAIVIDEDRVGGTHTMLALESGPAGSFPIN